MGTHARERQMGNFFKAWLANKKAKHRTKRMLEIEFFLSVK